MNPTSRGHLSPYPMEMIARPGVSTFNALSGELLKRKPPQELFQVLRHDGSHVGKGVPYRDCRADQLPGSEIDLVAVLTKHAPHCRELGKAVVPHLVIETGQDRGRESAYEILLDLIARLLQRREEYACLRVPQ